MRFSGSGVAGPGTRPEYSSAVAHKEELSERPGGSPCPSTEDFMSVHLQEAHVSLVQGKRVGRLTGKLLSRFVLGAWGKAHWGELKSDEPR